MAYVRSAGYKMKDPDDDEFAQAIVGDLERQAINLFRGTPNSAYALTPEAAANLNTTSPVTSTATSSRYVSVYETIGYVLGANVKLTFNQTSTDVNTMWDSANNRIIPNVAGYYFLQLNAYYNMSANQTAKAGIKRNGVDTAFAIVSPSSLVLLGVGAVNTYLAMAPHAIMYFNGSTDYAEAWYTGQATAFGAGGSLSAFLVS